jgi:hypothetical protein
MQSTATPVRKQGVIYNFFSCLSLHCSRVQVIAITRPESRGTWVTATMALKWPPMARFGGFTTCVFKRLRAREVSPVNILKLGEFQFRHPARFSLAIEKAYSGVSFWFDATFYSGQPEKIPKERLYLLQRSALATNLTPSRATNSSEFPPLLSRLQVCRTPNRIRLLN